MSLPAAWVDRIFNRLAVVYGEDFLARWRAVSLSDVKTDWSSTLGYYEADPGAIAWALENLPAARPPTVLQFRDLCRQAPCPEVPILQAPKADPARMATEVEKLRAVISSPNANVDRRDWARRIMARSEAGERVHAYTLASARIALGMEGHMEWQ